MATASAAGLKEWAGKHRRTLVLTGTACAAAYVVYRLARMNQAEGGGAQPSQQQQPQSSYARLVASVSRYYAAFSTGSELLSSLTEVAAVVSRDLATFLGSQSDEVPPSLRQLLKLVQSAEVQQAVRATGASLSQGVLAATSARLAALPQGAFSLDAALDVLMRHLLSSRGRSLLGMAISIASRQSTLALCQAVLPQQRESTGGSAAATPDGPAAAAGPSAAASARGAPASSTAGSGSAGWMGDVISGLATPQGEQVLALLVREGVRASVSSMMESSIAFNPTEEVLRALAQPEHRQLMADMAARLTSVAMREAAAIFRGQGQPGGQAANANAPARMAAAALQQRASGSYERAWRSEQRMAPPHLAGSELGPQQSWSPQQPRSLAAPGSSLVAQAVPRSPPRPTALPRATSSSIMDAAPPSSVSAVAAYGPTPCSVASSQEAAGSSGMPPALLQWAAAAAAMPELRSLACEVAACSAKEMAAAGGREAWRGMASTAGGLMSSAAAMVPTVRQGQLVHPAFGAIPLAQLWPLAVLLLGIALALLLGGWRQGGGALMTSNGGADAMARVLVQNITALSQK